MIKIAILGYGVVGSGIYEVIMGHLDEIKDRTHEEIEVKYILDLRDFDVPHKHLFVKDFDVILKDPEVAIVVEAMGGLHPAYDFAKAALENGKSVVTSNKEVVAEKGGELLNLAKKKNLNYLFEASVGGGIPIIRPINQCLAANNIDSVAGILNGTTNYILTEMFTNGKTFEAALKEAQNKGYAEANPSADVDGLDACRKICILASLCFGKHIYPKTVYTEGIRNIDNEVVALAEANGSIIKLIGKASLEKNGKIAVMVAPFVIKKSSPLYSVNDVFNGILVRGDALGDAMFYGKGAGKLPTASAAVADIIDGMKHMHSRKYLCWEETEPSDMDTIIEQHENCEFSYLVRATDIDEACVYAAFGECGIKKANGDHGYKVGPVLEKDFLQAAELLEKQADKKIKYYRILN